MSQFDLLSKRALSSLISFAIIFIASCFYASSTQLPLASITCLLTALPIIAAITCLVYAKLLNKEAQESEDIAKLNERQQQDIFADVQRPAKKALSNFVKYTAAIIASSSGIVLITSSVLLWPGAESYNDINFSNYIQGAAFALFFAVITILFAFYYNGASKEKNSSWLRPLVGWSFYITLNWLATVAVCMLMAERPETLLWTARVILCINAFIGLELITISVLDFYRPHRADQDTPLMESRVLSLISQPQNLTNNLSELLEYQFGIQLSPTWFRQNLLPQCFKVCLFLITSLWMLTCFHRIEEGQQAIRLTLGQASPSILEPGLHLSLPYPIQEMSIHDSSRIRHTIAGISLDEVADEHNFSIESAKTATEDVTLWSRTNHADEIHYLLPGKSDNDTAAAAEMAVIQLPVTYKIKNLHQFAFLHSDSHKALHSIAQQELLGFLSHMHWDTLFGSTRNQLARQIQERIQKKADAIKLGIEIVNTAVKTLHPPASICEDFDNIVAARFNRDAKIFAAEQNAAKTIGLAQNKATVVTSAAKASILKLDAISEERRKRFIAQMNNYDQNPRMFQLNSYLNLIEEHVRGLRKYIIVKENADQNIIFDFRKDLNSDIFGKLTNNKDK